MKIDTFKQKKIEEDDISLILLAKTNDKQIDIFDIDIDDSLRHFFLSAFNKTIKKYETLKIEKYDFDKNTDDVLLEFPSPESGNLDFTNTVSLNLAGYHTHCPNLKELYENNMKLFTYCIKFYDKNKNDSFYMFTKIQPSKIGIDEKQNIFRALFSTEGAKLTQCKDITISFTENIDFIFYNNEYLIFNKAMFEQIVDISKLIKKESDKALEELRNNSSISGVEIIEKFAKNKSFLQKRLIKLHSLGIYNNLDSDQLEKIRSVGNKHHIDVTIENSQLIIKDDYEEVTNICKLLCDYFKVGEISGKNYGTYAGDVLDS